MINNNIGLFLKTCAKDHAWLKWCLLSIQQNAIDFAGVCIITDKDHHYINYGKTFDPPVHKNAIELATQLTGIDQDIPFWFHSDRYEMLCPESESYFMPHWANMPKIYRLYHHYLNYGQHNNKILEGLQK
jgi:hypothetical protein